jgi:hypothetical protein
MTRRDYTPEQRSLYGRIGAHKSWAGTVDRSKRTQPARDAALARFEKQIDPDQVLPVAERRLRAEHARKAWMLELAAKSAKSRASRKAS